MSSPQILIGLPVFNGSKYIGSAIESLLNQTLSDFRLVIGDNASTDETEEICRSYARADTRINYFRHGKNLGGVANFRFVYQPAGEPYFKWTGHDDILEPTYLERCVSLLDHDSSLALAQSLTVEIDTTGAKSRTFYDDIRLSGARPRDRIWRLLWAKHLTQIWAVMRTELVDMIRPMGTYPGSDRNFSAELLLLGDMGYVEEHLLSLRSRPDAYGGGPARGKRSRYLWHDSNAHVPIVPSGLINLREYFRSVMTLPLPKRERLACLRVLAGWGIRRGFEEITGRHDSYRNKIAREYPLRREPS
jgi:glycosyltransferase involved in cell wall biosynthesis